MAVELPPLPWAENALEPDYSARTISFHYGKHHKAYVDKFNELSAGTPYADMKLEDVIKDTAGKADKAGLFNNAAQVWNHTFFWHSMKPGGGGKPKGELAVKIDGKWGGFDKFVEEFKAAAVARFGSGWAWLVLKDGDVDIVTTPNAETPLTTSAKPLADRRRLGACLLPGLPELASRVCPGVLRQPGELGRGAESLPEGVSRVQ